MHDPRRSWPLFRTAMERKLTVMNSKHLGMIQIVKKFFVKWRAKANSERGTEEDHQKFRELRKGFKKIMNEKMQLNVEDESDTSLFLNLKEILEVC